MTLRTLIVVLLAGFGFARIAGRFDRTAGVDFYHFWGVQRAMEASGGRLGSPYRETDRYAAVLDGIVGETHDTRLQDAHRHRIRPDLTGTPLLYASFALLPGDYSVAFALYQAAQVLLFLASVLALGWLAGLERGLTVTLALVLLVVYEPLASDLRVGNVSTFQLFALAALVAGASRGLGGAASARRPVLRGGALLTVAVWLALFKPNLALIPVLLAAHLAARFGRAAAAMCAVALAAGLALAALPCLYFGSFAVWTDWLGAIGGENAGRLVFPVADGNYATVRIALEVLGLAPAAAAAGLATLVAVAVIFAARGPRGLARALRSPDVSLALAVSVTLAIAPLLWLHYYVIAVCPALWLLSRPGAAPHLGGLGLLLSSGALSGLAAFAGAPAAIPLLHALCWPALVGGTLLEVRRAAHPDPARPC